MSNELIFRAADSADIEQLIALGLLAYGQLASQLSTEGWEQMKTGIGNTEMWQDILGKAKGFVCCTGTNDIVGMAFLVPSGNPWGDIYPNDWSYIRMVGVHPEFGGRGIGRKLTQQCIEAAKQSEEHTIALHTSEVMDAARHIYEGLGFYVVREIESRFGIRYWLYRMALTDNDIIVAEAGNT